MCDRSQLRAENTSISLADLAGTFSGPAEPITRIELVAALHPVSKGSAWSDSVEVIDADTDQPIDLTGATGITIELRDKTTSRIALEGSLGNEISAPMGHRFNFTFPASVMQGLEAKPYEVTIAFAIDGRLQGGTLGTVPIVESL